MLEKYNKMIESSNVSLNDLTYLNEMGLSLEDIEKFYKDTNDIYKAIGVAVINQIHLDWDEKSAKLYRDFRSGIQDKGKGL